MGQEMRKLLEAGKGKEQTLGASRRNQPRETHFGLQPTELWLQNHEVGGSLLWEPPS